MDGWMEQSRAASLLSVHNINYYRMSSCWTLFRFHEIFLTRQVLIIRWNESEPIFSMLHFILLQFQVRFREIKKRYLKFQIRSSSIFVFLAKVRYVIRDQLNSRLYFVQMSNKLTNPPDFSFPFRCRRFRIALTANLDLSPVGQYFDKTYYKSLKILAILIPHPLIMKYEMIIC